MLLKDIQGHLLELFPQLGVGLVHRRLYHTPNYLTHSQVQ